MKPQIALFLFILIIFSGCATVFNGYETTINIKNLPDSVKVVNSFGEKIPIVLGNFYFFKDSSGSLGKRHSGTISVRAKEIQELKFYYVNKEFMVYHQAKVGLGWFALDIVLGGVGTILDAYTGNWYCYPDLILEN